MDGLVVTGREYIARCHSGACLEVLLMSRCIGCGECGVMLAAGRGKTGGGGGQGCGGGYCCYCDLYSLAEEWGVYREEEDHHKLPYPATPLAYTPSPPPPAPTLLPPPCPIHEGSEKPPPPPPEPLGEEDLKALHHPAVPAVSPDVAAAFLLSLDMLRLYPQHHALHHALYHALQARALKQTGESHVTIARNSITLLFCV